MTKMHLVLGISADENERSEARIFRFDDGKFTASYATSKMPIRNPRDSKNHGDRVAFHENAINGLIQKVESEGFKIRSRSKGIAVDAVGISMPGNIDIENHIVRNTARFGQVPNRTPFSDFLPSISVEKACNIELPLSINNDVTCMAKAESYLRFKDSLKSFVYLYIDTGVNIGVVINGTPLPSAMHPEVGHLLPKLKGKPRRWTLKGEDDFCGFKHGGCFEGVLARSALQRRFKLDEMLESDKGFKSERAFISQCIAELCQIILLCFAPEKIVVGGYVNEALLKTAQIVLETNLKKYALYPERQEENFIELSPNPPHRIAALGAALLAYRQLTKHDDGIEDPR